MLAFTGHILSDEPFAVYNWLTHGRTRCVLKWPASRIHAMRHRCRCNAAGNPVRAGVLASYEELSVRFIYASAFMPCVITADATLVPESWSQNPMKKLSKK
jgi:hypothetical protein